MYITSGIIVDAKYTSIEWLFVRKWGQNKYKVYVNTHPENRSQGQYVDRSFQRDRLLWK